MLTLRFMCFSIHSFKYIQRCQYPFLERILRTDLRYFYFLSFSIATAHFLFNEKTRCRKYRETAPLNNIYMYGPPLFMNIGRCLRRCWRGWSADWGPERASRSGACTRQPFLVDEIQCLWIDMKSGEWGSHIWLDSIFDMIESATYCVSPKF